MSALLLPYMPSADPDRLAAAVRAVIGERSPELLVGARSDGASGPRTLSGRLPSSERLGADPGFRDALLEAVYLVAAADGLSDAEASALGSLVGAALGGHAEGVTQLFRRFAEQRDQSGLQQRLHAVAEQLKDFDAREEVLAFAALIAIADRELGHDESDALLELGSHFGFATGEVQGVVDRVAQRLGSHLG